MTVSVDGSGMGKW